MSYDMCKRITLNEKKNIIKVCVASNNVTPKYYETCEVCNSEKPWFKDFTFEDKLLTLFKSLQDGSIQVTTMNDNTVHFEYALCKVREWLRENNLRSYDDLYEKNIDVNAEKRLNYSKIERSTLEDENERRIEDWKRYRTWASNYDKEEIKILEEKLELETLWEVYGKVFEIFKKALYEKIEGEYKVLFDDVYFVTKLGRYDRGYDRFSYANKAYDKFEKMDYKKAYVFCSDMGSKRDLKILKV